MTKKDDELAKLKARVEELERAAKPPEPFKPQPHQQYDPTAGMSMPLSTMLEMARAVPDHVLRDIAMRDNRAPTGRPGMIPTSQQPSGGGGPSPSSTPGWVEPTPLGPPPGINWVDAQLIADDVKQRSKDKR
jgi:hypothetical protein